MTSDTKEEETEAEDEQEDSPEEKEDDQSGEDQETAESGEPEEKEQQEETEEDEKNYTTAVERQNQLMKNAITFFTIGSVVLMVLIGVVYITGNKIPFLGGGDSENGQNSSEIEIDFSTVEKKAKQDMSEANEFYKKADQQKDPELYEKAIAHYEKGRDRLREYEKKVNEHTPRDNYSVKQERVWSNLTRMIEQARKRKKKLLGESPSSESNRSVVKSQDGSSNESNDEQNGLQEKLSSIEGLKEEDRKAFKDVFNRIEKIKKQLSAASNAESDQEMKSNYESARENFQSVEETLTKLSSSNDGNRQVSSYIMSIRQDILFGIKKDLDDMKSRIPPQ